jgi:hypothetical protein
MADRPLEARSRRRPSMGENKGTQHQTRRPRPRIRAIVSSKSGPQKAKPHRFEWAGTNKGLPNNLNEVPLARTLRYQDASSTRYKSAPLRKLCCCRTRLGVWQKGTPSALNWALLPPPERTLFRPRTSQLRRDLALHTLDGRATTASQSRSACCVAPA